MLISEDSLITLSTIDCNLASVNLVHFIDENQNQYSLYTDVLFASSTNKQKQPHCIQR
jgi:hypothetical protein